MSARRLVLFDIDGTLLRLHGTGDQALRGALEEVWQCSTAGLQYDYGGKTERLICHELLAMAGVSRHEVEVRIDRFWEVYARHLKQLLDSARVHVLPKVPELLAAVQQEKNLVMGLLTGNCSQAAQLKLEAANLDGFQIGVYGADHEDRRLLGPLALKKAKQELGWTLQGQHTLVVGDTPNDITCARHIGAVAVAVATGRYSFQQLQDCQPDLLFKDFSSTQQVLQALMQ